MKSNSNSEKPSFFDWIDDYMNTFDCDFDTAAREYHYYFYPETYNAEDYDCEEY